MATSPKNPTTKSRTIPARKTKPKPASAQKPTPAVAKRVSPKASKDIASEKPTLSAVVAADRPPTEVTVTNRTMLERVAERAELRPNQVRPVYEAVLEELGMALVKGEKLKLPSLGTLRVNKQKSIEGAEIVICKLRRKTKDVS